MFTTIKYDNNNIQIIKAELKTNEVDKSGVFIDFIINYFNCGEEMYDFYKVNSSKLSINLN